MKRIQIFENGINVVFEITDEKLIKLLHFSALPFNESTITSKEGNTGFDLVEMKISGIDSAGEWHGNKCRINALGNRLKYKNFKDINNSIGRKLEIVCFDEETGLETVSHMQFYTGTRAVRVWTDVNNCSTENRTLEYVSSFSLAGIEKEGLQPQNEKLRVGICHNSMQRELQWRFYSPEQQNSSNVLGVTNVGNLSSKEYIPMGYAENTEVGGALMWQIEHNGSWHWEISDHEGHLYLQLSGPSEIGSHWSKILRPGDSFRSVYCGVCAVNGGFNEAIAEMTKYRRLIRRKSRDNTNLPVIFNGCLNCLWTDPTNEKELSLIDAAAEVGCEYFCIDAGLYADDIRCDRMGGWNENRKILPDELREVTDHIRKKRMIPGVRLEIEAMGIKCPMADDLPDEWFFVRNGKRVIDKSRYQLDFRVPAVREYCDAAVDRLINEYGFGYIKMDYNIESGIGTENNADSFGDGLLEHERAYLAWLDGVFERHPKVIVENCSDGGRRMDYALLSRCSIQSIPNQEDFRKYAAIAANAPSAVCPEQAAVRSFLSETDDREEVVFNMVNAMLSRVHLSGHLDRLDSEIQAIVKEGIEVYRSIRRDIAKAVPFYPLGVSEFSDTWSALGLRCDGRIYLAVWQRDGSENCSIPIDNGLNDVKVRCIYPSYNEEKYAYDPNNKTLTVRFGRPNIARLFMMEERS
ncbi:alpha-galactosidase [Ruminococcus albus SY3]|uniref:Alpha-galactosidase n=1 Tax=Ruminococcus albus SY3 TaxID=1341156 RepID=A0A011UIP8_RUMAL|nr:glycoside hydrolase family 36 protein [Ruminococcus albus]EXM40524.1 alpha-galactosidase [Ruminococcus albus SY3]